MKLIYYPYDLKCDFFCEKFNRIIIEEKRIFEEFLVNAEKTINKEGEYFYLNDDGDEINFAKSTILISSPLDLRYLKKEFQKALYNKLVEEMQINEIQEKVADYYATLIEEIDLLKSKTQYSFDFNEDLDYNAIFKMLNIELSQPEGTFIEKLLDYLETEVELMGKSIFIVANCSAYIDEMWYDEIVKWSQYKNVITIFVENKQDSFDKNINEYILDKDMCEIH